MFRCNPSSSYRTIICLAMQARPAGTWLEAFCSVLGAQLADFPPSALASVATSVATILRNEAMHGSARSATAGGVDVGGEVAPAAARPAVASGQAAAPAGAEHRRVLRVVAQTLRDALYQVRGCVAGGSWRLAAEARVLPNY